MRTDFAGAALIATLVATPALAHPHVLVDAKSEIVFDKGKITAVRHIWQFDAAFTAYATQGLDANNDGKLSDAELQPLAKVNVDSLSMFGYFTYLKADGKDVDFASPTEYFLQFYGSRLTLFYTLPLKAPLAAKTATLEVFDPEYFVAFTYVKDKPVALDGAPDACSVSYRPPKPLDLSTAAILGAIPADQTIIPANLRDVVAGVANLITVACK